jgi:hypothetical protein
MRISVSSDGWTSLTGPPGTDGLHLRIRYGDDRRVVITDVYVHGQEVTNDALRAISIPRLEAYLASSGLAVIGDDDEVTTAKLRARRARPVELPASDREPLTRPGRTDLDEFYRRVARAYVELTPKTRAPAKEIAAEADVPVTTAHRWIREARRRGALPPARHGRAG